MTKRVVGILLVLALVLGAAARPLSAQAPAAVRVTARTAQIMSRPSAEAEVVLSADAGTVLNVVDTDGQWYSVLLSPDRSGVRRRGWIQARDVQLVSAATVTSPPIPPTAEEMRAMQKSGQVVGSTAAAPTPTDPKPEANRRVERAQLELEKARREYEAAAGQSSSSQSTTSITAPDNAQVANDQRRLFTPPTPRQSLGFRAFGAVDVDALTAQKSFDAVLGTSQLTAFGGGADVLNVWKTAFVRVAVSHATGSGNRAFVLNGQPVSLNIPIKVSKIGRAHV